MDYLVLHYPPCSTCRRALTWLHDHNKDCQYRNIKEEKPAVDELTQWIALSGLPAKKFFNTSGMLYKSMELKDKLPSMNEKEQIELLATDGMLIKRPLLVGKGIVLVGFKEDQWEEKLV